MPEGMGPGPEAESNSRPELEAAPRLEGSEPPRLPATPVLENPTDNPKLFLWFDELRQWRRNKVEPDAPEPPSVEAAADNAKLQQFKQDMEQWKRDHDTWALANRRPPSVNNALGMDQMIEAETYAGDVRPPAPEAPEPPHIRPRAGEAPEPPPVKYSFDRPSLEPWFNQIDLWMRGAIDKAPDPPRLSVYSETQKFAYWKQELEQWMQTLRSEAPKAPEVAAIDARPEHHQTPEISQKALELQRWFDKVERWRHTSVAEAPEPPQVDSQADSDKLQLWLRELEQWKRDYAEWDRANIRRPVPATPVQSPPASEQPAGPTVPAAPPVPPEVTGEAEGPEDDTRSDEDDRTRELVSHR